jgi:hypothetical protein
MKRDYYSDIDLKGADIETIIFTTKPCVGAVTLELA